MTALERRPGELCRALYGLVVTSPFPFENRLAVVDDPPDLWFRPAARSPIGDAWRSLPPVYRSPLKIDEEQHVLDIVVAPRATVLHFSEVVDFYLFADGIAYVLLDDAYAHMVELHFLGVVMSWWLERDGWIALHASAVTTGVGAIAFLSNHGGGKTSLAATLLGHGARLLTDDVLAVRGSAEGVVGRPGYPQMRMWPEQARHFVGHDDLAVVHPTIGKLRVPVGERDFGSFDASPRRVLALYLPRRREGGATEITDLTRGEALFELVRHTFFQGIVHNAELSRRRLASLGAVVERVPVRSLVYPAGLERLPAIVRDVIRNAERV